MEIESLHDKLKMLEKSADAFELRTKINAHNDAMLQHEQRLKDVLIASNEAPERRAGSGSRTRRSIAP